MRSQQSNIDNILSNHNWILAQINQFIEKLFFRLVRRKREARSYLTDHNDIYIAKAMKNKKSPLKFYSMTHPVRREDFTFFSKKIRKGIEIVDIQFVPSFYHPKVYKPSEDKKCRNNKLTIYSRNNCNSKVAMVFLNAWGVKESTDSDHRLAENLAHKYGISVVISTLPYHRHRTPTGFESGELALNGDSSACLRSFKQAVEESIAIAKYLTDYAGFESVGIGGISLGGIIASVTSYIFPFDFCVQMLASGSLANIIWDSQRLQFLKQQFLKGGVSKTILDNQWSVIDPTSFISNSRTSNILLILGSADTVIPWHISKKYSEILQANQSINLKIHNTNYSHYTGIFFAHHLSGITGEFILHATKKHTHERKVFEWNGTKMRKSVAC